MTERRSLRTAITSTDLNADAEKVRAFVTQSLPRESTTPKPNSMVRGYRLPLISVTLRLRQETANALVQASLERKIRGEPIHTQQEILEQALEPWLRQNGYWPK